MSKVDRSLGYDEKLAESLGFEPEDVEEEESPEELAESLGFILTSQEG